MSLRTLTAAFVAAIASISALSPISATAQTPAAAAPDTMTITFMTYNLRFGELADMDRIAAEIKKYNPDFVAIQEVDVNNSRVIAHDNNRGKNYVNELAVRTGFFGYYGRTFDFPKGGYYGIGMLSRWPAEKIEKFELPNPENHEPRVLLMGVFELPGHKMTLASTHFDHKKDPATRTVQAHAFTEKLLTSPYPVLVGGDFNADGTSECIRHIKTKMKDLTNDRLTWPAQTPRSKLDFIFAYPADNFTLRSCTVPEPSDDAPSDHLPVISEILVTF